MLALTADKLVTPADVVERPLAFVDGGKVVEITTRVESAIPSGTRHLDFPGKWIAPGYLDLHIHGSAGFDVMSQDGEALPAIEKFIVRHGATSYYPTTVTAPFEATLRALQRLADAIEARRKPGSETAKRACPLGIHLEGPFISHARRGVHPVEHLLPPNVATFDKLWQAARGHIRMMTIAPELDGATEVIDEAARRGVCVSLGHSDANLRDTERGIAAGARHATHTFNAMRPLDHRNPGILAAVLTDACVSADIIADGVHVDPAAVKLFADAKGFLNTTLITDATAATGMTDGRYALGSFTVEVKDGRCTLDGKLAGSVLTMDRAVQNLSRFAEWSLPEAVAAATRNPARVAGLSGKGTLAAGSDADFVVLSANGEIEHTFISGVEC